MALRRRQVDRETLRYLASAAGVDVNNSNNTEFHKDIRDRMSDHDATAANSADKTARHFSLKENDGKAQIPINESTLRHYDTWFQGALGEEGYEEGMIYKPIGEIKAALSVEVQESDYRIQSPEIRLREREASLTRAYDGLKRIVGEVKGLLSSVDRDATAMNADATQLQAEMMGLANGLADKTHTPDQFQALAAGHINRFTSRVSTVSKDANTQREKLRQILSRAESEQQGYRR